MKQAQKQSPIDYMRNKVTMPFVKYLQNRKDKEGYNRRALEDEVFDMVEAGDVRFVPKFDIETGRVTAHIEVTDKGFFGSLGEQDHMKQKKQPYVSADNYILKTGALVRLSPRRGGRVQFNTARVVEAGQWKSLVLPANHHASEWCDNEDITIHKSRCIQAGIQLELAKQEASPQTQTVSQADKEQAVVQIRNAYSNDFNHKDFSPKPPPAPAPVAKAAEPAPTASQALTQPVPGEFD